MKLWGLRDDAVIESALLDNAPQNIFTVPVTGGRIQRIDPLFPSEIQYLRDLSFRDLPSFIGNPVIHAKLRRPQTDFRHDVVPPPNQPLDP